MTLRQHAQLVFLDTPVYTADPGRPWARALAVAGGQIACVGDTAACRPWIGPATEVCRCPDGLLLPGFRDTHIHPLQGSLALLECRLTGPADPRAYGEQILTYARANEGQPFLRGSGWLPDAFPPPGPRREALDALVADRPVLLKSMDGHNAWVNSLALREAGIDRETPDPPGGLIVRDAATGEPTGLLREWTAMALVEAQLPAPAARDLATAGWAFQERALRLGVVSIHEAMATAEALAAYRSLEESGELALYVQAAILCDPPGGADRVAEILRHQATCPGPLVRPRAVKLFLDGVLEGHTARLLTPYADRRGCRGELLWRRRDLYRTVAAIDAAGLQVHCHAIGDAAVRLALDALEEARRLNGRRDARPLIAHCDLVSPRDIPRFAELGAVPLLQPAWFYAEQNFATTTLAALGPRRAHRLYRMGSLLAAGAAVACGSDWPFSGELNTFNPLEAIQVGVTRRGLAPGAAPPYGPAERVALAALINGFTRGAAWADFQEARTGTLAAGRSADLALLDRNLFTMAPEEIAGVQVLLTLFQGRPVWRAPGLPGAGRGPQKG